MIRVAFHGVGRDTIVERPSITLGSLDDHTLSVISGNDVLAWWDMAIGQWVTHGGHLAGAITLTTVEGEAHE
jgi:hypothetical protein